MKKQNTLWMLAAILICGTMFFDGCKKNEKPVNPTIMRPEV